MRWPVICLLMLTTGCGRIGYDPLAAERTGDHRRGTNESSAALGVNVAFAVGVDFTSRRALVAGPCVAQAGPFFAFQGRRSDDDGAGRRFRPEGAALPHRTRAAHFTGGIISA